MKARRRACPSVNEPFRPPLLLAHSHCLVRSQQFSIMFVHHLSEEKFLERRKHPRFTGSNDAKGKKRKVGRGNSDQTRRNGWGRGRLPTADPCP